VVSERGQQEAEVENRIRKIKTFFTHFIQTFVKICFEGYYFKINSADHYNNIVYFLLLLI
jgi:hypothetical protein